MHDDLRQNVESLSSWLAQDPDLICGYNRPGEEVRGDDAADRIHRTEKMTSVEVVITRQHDLACQQVTHAHAHVVSSRLIDSWVLSRQLLHPGDAGVGAGVQPALLPAGAGKGGKPLKDLDASPLRPGRAAMPISVPVQQLGRKGEDLGDR